MSHVRLAFALFTIGLLGVASPALAGFAYVPEITHSGNTVPTTEGWGLTVSGTGTLTTTAVTGDTGGYNAWKVNDASTTGSLSYRNDAVGGQGVMTAPEIAAALADGWKMTARVRAVNTSDTTDFGVSFGVSFSPTLQFTLDFGTDASGNQIVRLVTGVGAFPFPTTGPSYTSTGGNIYHLYELIYDPIADNADLFVDGVERISDFVGNAGGNPAGEIWFGARTTNLTGNGNYNFVQLSVLTAIPEPASATVVTLGSLILLRRRRAA